MLCAAGAALATPEIATSPSSEPDEPKDRSTDIALGLILGGTDVGDVDGPGVGFQLMIGRRFGPLALLGEYAYHSVGDGPNDAQSRNGNVNRLGVVARFDAWSIGAVDGRLRGALYFEGGAGRHHVAWDKGGSLTRNDLSFGFGFQQRVRVGDTRRSIGWFTGLRGQLARAPDVDATPTCDGPCDTLTVPSRRDLSLFWMFGINFGR
jgi:hypothetical protein